MIRIVVRSGKDRDAVRACIDRVVRDPDIEVVSLGGFRDPERLRHALADALSSERINIVIAGREDSELLTEALSRDLPNTVLHTVPAKKVRNLRIEHLAWEINRAKARFRNRVYWSERLRKYLLIHEEGCRSVIDSSDPADDVYLCYPPGCTEILNSVTGLDRELYLVTRRLGGVADVYYGPRRVARIRIPDCLREIEVLELEKPLESFGLTMRSLLDANREFIEMLEHVSKSFLLRHGGDARRVIVPWSGGKDSTAALLLAREVFDNTIAVYIDTGVDFPENREYVEEMASRLGIELIIERAPVREELERGRALPTHEDRWCTALKIESIVRTVKRLGLSTVIVGDRDAESRSRSLRPFVRVENGIRYLYPIKIWSTLHVQLFLEYKHVPHNPLYDAGFYRIGCYICPSLRSWELMAMKRVESYSVVSEDELFKRFVRTKLMECSST